MDLYNFDIIFKSCSTHIINHDILSKINESIKVFKYYSVLKSLLTNHPMYDIQGTNVGIYPLYDSKFKPIVLEPAQYFNSFSYASIRKYLLNKIILSNTQKYVESYTSITEHSRNKYINIIMSKKNESHLYLSSDNNSFFQEVYIPYFNKNNILNTLSLDDENLLNFVYELLKYFNSHNELFDRFDIHYDVIAYIIKSVFNINIFQTLFFNDLAYIIVNILQNTSSFKDTENEYICSSIVIYTIETNKATFHNFVSYYSLYTSILNSIIF